MSYDPSADFAAKIIPFQPRERTYLHLITYWQITSARTGRPITCAGFRATGGFELRVLYSDREIILTKQFRGPGAWRRMKTYSAEAHQAVQTMAVTGSAPHGEEA